MPRKIIAGLVLSAIALSTPTLAYSLEVGVAWQGKSGMAKRVLAGFQEQMQEIVPDANIEILPELTSPEELDNVITQFEGSKDAMVVLRSNGAKRLGKRAPKIPAMIGGTNHPGHLGVVADLAAPEGNITGVTYFIDYETRLESFIAVVPDIESLHLLVEKGHPSGQVDIDGTMAACAALNLTCSHSVVKGHDEIVAAIADQGSASLIVIGNQAGLYDEHMGEILATAGEFPVAAYAAGAVKLGALTAISANDHKLGRMLAAKMMEIVGEGLPVQDVPVGFDESPTLFVNMATLSSLGLELAPELFEGAQLIE